MPFDVRVTQTAGVPLPVGTELSVDIRVIPSPVLQPSDFTYLGYGLLPMDTAGTRFGYSTGAMSGRVVNGAIHLFITQATQETGWNDNVAEVVWAGPGQRMTLAQNWGDITLGKRVSAAGNPKPIKGLLWDEQTQQLIWTYLDQYNVIGAADPCIGATTLTLPAVSVAGPWRMTDICQRVGGYLAAIPSRLQAALGGQFLAGAPLGSGDAGSAFGTFAAAFTLPAPSTPPDTPTDGGHITIPSTHLIYSDITHRQARLGDVDECSWDHYGESNAQGHQPQMNPVQDGRGCTVDGDLCGSQFGPSAVFNHIDRVSSSVWIDGPNKQGVVYFSQMSRTMSSHLTEYGTSGRCHVWYGPAQNFGVDKLCVHGQNDTRYGMSATGPGCTTMQSSLFIYDPAVLASVAAGTKSPIGVVPSTDADDMSQIAAPAGTPFPQLATSQDQYGGAWWEPASQLAFVSAIHSEWQGEWRPVVHAFKVAC